MMWKGNKIILLYPTYLYMPTHKLLGVQGSWCTVAPPGGVQTLDLKSAIRMSSTFSGLLARRATLKKLVKREARLHVVD